MENLIAILLGCYLIYLGLNIIDTGLFDAYYGYMIKLDVFKYPMSIFFIFIGVFIFYKVYKNFKTNKYQKQTSYSKCPKCKTAYDYQDLENGMCPKCHIKTIEMEEYFKQFPKELKKKEP